MFSEYRFLSAVELALSLLFSTSGMCASSCENSKEFDVSRPVDQNKDVKDNPVLKGVKNCSGLVGTLVLEFGLR